MTDTREQAREKMLADWNEQRLETAEGRTVMLTDTTNVELDELNQKAQEYRDQAGELGNDRVQLLDTPYALAAGDHVIFTKSLHHPGQERVHNGTVGIVKDVEDEHILTVDTQGTNEREVNVNTKDFPDLRLAYAQHVYKGLGLTANNCLALIGGWQTDREHTYVALTRAREQTNIYVSKQDLGAQGIPAEAIERLAEKMQQSNTQQASITREPVATARALTQGIETIRAPSIEDGIGGVVSQNVPDSSPEIDIEQAGERSRQANRDHGPSQLTNEQQPNEHDTDQAHDFGLGID